MAPLIDAPIQYRDDIARFEAELMLDERLPERSVFDVFLAGAARWPERTANHDALKRCARRGAAPRELP